MILTTGSSQRAAMTTAYLCAATITVGALTWLPTSAFGERRDSPRSSESVDTRSVSTRGVFGSEAYLCSSNHEELKKAKFGGDFAAMLKWWRQNKVAEHRALAGRSPAVSAR
jgi:hypothetical protein